METIDKPWGKEEILAVEKQYVVKRLHMNPGKRCSLQYHKKKTETIYVLSGVLRLHLGDKMITMKSGEFITILPGVVHRMEGGQSVGQDEPAIYLESSTIELDDVVRVEDDYGRS